MGKSLVERLKQEIRRGERQGVTRYRLAKLSGVSEGQLSRLARGTVAPRLDSTERIADALGLRIVFVPKKKNLPKR